MTDDRHYTAGGVQEGSTGELVRRATEQPRLVRDELALARAEMTAKGQRAAAGAGLLGGGGLVALYGDGSAADRGRLGLAQAMPPVARRADHCRGAVRGRGRAGCVGA